MKDYTRPLVSIVIPYYNKGPEIPQTLASISRAMERHPSARAYTEVIIVDDGSSADQADVLNSALQRGSLKVQVIKQPNGGVSSARNTGIKAAMGEYLYFLDADDHLLKDFFLAVSADIEAWPIAQACWVPLLINGRLLSTGMAGEHQMDDGLLLSLLNNRCLHLSCVLFKKSAVEGTWFDERFKSAEDLLYIAMALRGVSVAFTDRPYAIYNYDGKFHKADSSGYAEFLQLAGLEEPLKNTVRAIYNERKYLHNRFFKAGFDVDRSAIRMSVKLFGLLGSHKLYQSIQAFRFRLQRTR
jgi:glycosyltransferase involved in cell wall biosynthesis